MNFWSKKLLMAEKKEMTEYGFWANASSGNVYLSKDGKSWEPLNGSKFIFPSGNTCYGGGVFLFCGIPTLYSKDIPNVEELPSFDESNFFVNAIYKNGCFLAGSSVGSVQTGQTYRSTDGINYTSVLPNHGYQSLFYHNGVFSAFYHHFSILTTASTTSNTYYYSTDNGVSWTSATLPSSVGMSTHSASGNGKIVICPENTGNMYVSTMYYSEDGKTFNQISLPSQTGGSGISLAFGNGVFVMCSYSYCLYSYDGVIWNIISSLGDHKRVVFGNGKFIATSTNSSAAYYSTNGIDWKAYSLPTTFSGVVFKNGIFLACYGSVPYTSYYYSTDGIVWEQQNFPEAMALCGNIK